MNNGDINNTNQTNNTTQPAVMQMPGVKIAPPQEGPINASNIATATSANNPGINSYNNQSNTMQNPTNVMAPSPNITTQLTNIQPQVTPNQIDNINNNNSAPSVTETPPVNPVLENKTAPKPKKNGGLILLLFLIIIGLGFYAYYITKSDAEKIKQLAFNCTPINAQEETELNINSTIVQDLYNKVYTTIREDYANPYLNEEMKLYLAYRQITEKEKYDSNCNLFSTTSMEPYTCEESTMFKPRAFKEETFIREYKKLFGENSYYTLNNIQLGNTCIIGYQYIKERGEFVEGFCNRKTATSFKAEKKLSSATSTGNTIVLTEEVKYKAGENMELPSYLKSGTYRYTFRLDMNYNYILISKAYESKY